MRRQREQAPVPVQIRVLRPVPARARGAILDPVSHAPIELRKDMGSTAPPL